MATPFLAQKTGKLRRPAEAAAVSAGRAGGLSHRRAHPGAGDRSGRLARAVQGPAGRHPGHVQHVLRRRAVALLHLRPGHHALHLGLDHHADDGGGHAEPGSSCARKASPAGARSPSTRATVRWAWRCSSPWASPSRCRTRRRGRSHPGLGFASRGDHALVTGTMFLMWLGEQITERGMGNGISMHHLRRHRRRAAERLGGTLDLVRTGADESARRACVILVLVVGRDRLRGVRRARPAHASR